MSQSGKQFSGNNIERLSSSGEEREAHVLGSACAHADLLHELSKVLGGMVMNAQVMQWKLPAYSHSKRYVREIERSAQRGGSMVDQLMRCLGVSVLADEESCGNAVTAQEPSVDGINVANQPRCLLTHAAPAFSGGRLGRTHTRL